MPSSYTTSLRLTLPANGELAGSWGSTVNTGVTSLAEAAIAGTAAVTMTDADYTLTVANGAADQARNMFITLTGTLTAARNVICPSVSKLYIVTNSTTGSQTITFKTLAGSGISVANGQRKIVYCNGTSVVDALTSFSTLRFSAGSVSAPSISFDGNTTTGLWLPTTSTIAVSTAGAERLRIDSIGNVGIATTAPAVALQIGGDATYRELRLLRSVNGTTAQALNFLKTRGTETVPLVVASGDTLGTINFTGYSGTQNLPAAGISTVVSETPGAAAMSGSLYFFTNGASTALSTRLILNHNGHIGFGGSTVNAGWPTTGFYADLPGNRAAFGAQTGGQQDVFFASTNSYATTNDAGTTPWLYKAAGAAQLLSMRSGFQLKTAPVGTAGGTITWTNALTISTAGNVGVGTTSPVVPLDVNGALKVSNVTTTNTAVALGGTDAIAGKRVLVTFPATPIWSGKVRVYSPRNALDASGVQRMVAEYTISRSGTTTGAFAYFTVSNGQSDTGSITSDFIWYFNSATGTPYLRFGQASSTFDFVVTTELTTSTLPTVVVDAGTAPSGVVVNPLYEIAAVSTGGVTLDTAGSPRLYIDTSGNVGISAAPSPWASTLVGALQVRGATLTSNTTGTVAYLGSNLYYDGAYKYITTGFASQLQQINGQFQFLTAPSGAAGATATPTVAMTLNASGNLGIGVASPVNKLDIAGSLGRGAPAVKTADFTLAATESWLINNKAATACIATLPAASAWTGREVMFLNYQPLAVTSASANVVPRTGAAAGTAILPATDGAWATLVSNGTNWVVVADGVSSSTITLPLAATDGGTGQSSYAVGDLLYASTTTALSKLADVAVGNSLISGGVGVAPAWGKIGLTTHVSGTLPIANGGTGLTALGANVATWLGTPTSANLRAAVTDETGTGSLVFATSPTLVTPILGTPQSGNFSTGAFTWPTFNQSTTGTASGLSATLVATSGGTGQSVYAVGDILYASTTTALSKLADVVTGNALLSGGVGVAPAWGKIGLTTHVSGTLPVANGGTGATASTGSGNVVLATSPTLVTPILGTPQSGNFSTGSFTWPTFNQNTTGTAAGLSATLVATRGGTGQASYAIGDLLYASTTTALSKLADVATGNALISGGVGVAPAWGKIGLTTHVSGTLPVANGGTGVTASTGSGSNVLSTSPTLTTPILGAATITSINGGQIAGFRNKLINGDMGVDQRNGGATIVNSSNYTLDRWSDNKIGTGQYSAGYSTVAPTGFGSSLLHTVTNAVTPAVTDVYQIFQAIEAYNVADLAFGTASASPITVSFWVRSSVTGTYAFSVSNGVPASTSRRAYVSTYTVTAANTWEQKTVTIPGDTSGTWLKNTNGIGLILLFDLGSGSNSNTTAGSWQSGTATNELRRTAGAVSLISTSGATFYLTGVQIEAGSTATPFERIDATTKVMCCQRYYEAGVLYGVSYAASGTSIQRAQISFAVAKRIAPSVSVAVSSGSLTSPSVVGTQPNAAWVGFTATGAGLEGIFTYSASSEF